MNKFLLFSLTLLCIGCSAHVFTVSRDTKNSDLGKLMRRYSKEVIKKKALPQIEDDVLGFNRKAVKKK